MISELVKFHNHSTTKLGIATSDLEPRQKVAQNAWNWLELCARQVASVYWASRLTIQPVIDAGRTERMLAVCCLATNVNTRLQTPVIIVIHGWKWTTHTVWRPLVPCKSSYHCDNIVIIQFPDITP